MAIGDFYTQVILVALSAAALLGVLWKHYTDSTDKLENSENQEGYLIASHIWATNIKKAVEEFFNYIQENISKSESQDKYVELFSDEERIPTLKNRLDTLDKSYGSYVAFNSLLPYLIQGTEKLKTWLIRTICVCFAFTVWGLVGFLIDSETAFLGYASYFWFSLAGIVFAAIISIGGIVLYNRKCQSIKSRIRQEKSKYSAVIRKVT